MLENNAMARLRMLIVVSMVLWAPNSSLFQVANVWACPEDCLSTLEGIELVNDVRRVGISSWLQIMDPQACWPQGSHNLTPHMCLFLRWPSLNHLV